MRRCYCPERPDWRQQAEALGFSFHSIYDAPYWVDDGYYAFSLAQIENDLEAPTLELHEMAMDLVQAAVRDESLLLALNIPEKFWSLVLQSYQRGDPHLYGRLDLSYNGTGPAKLLELNYDTPTSLFESAFFQWLWLEDGKRLGHIPQSADQFNSLQERLLQRLPKLQPQQPFYFSSVAESEEDYGTVVYLEDLARQAGFDTRHIAIENIGVNQQGQFVDEQAQIIKSLFKLYPWEFMLEDEFSNYLLSSQTQFIEPIWKLILSNKGALALLWQRHPGHPNLLPTFFDDGRQALPQGWVRKPFFSREGANIELHSAKGHEKVPGPYGNAPKIRQQLAALPQFGHFFTVVGSWVVGDEACGICLREDYTPITRDTSLFLPHIIID